MRSQGHRGYREYRGRRSGSLVLKFIIGVLAVLLVAGLIVMKVADEYVEYTDEGVIIHWPWAQEQEEALPSEGLVIVTQEPEPAPTEEPTPAPTPQPLQAIQGVCVTIDQVRGGTAADYVTQAVGNALVVEMKSPSGALAWISQTAQAAALGVNAADNAVAEAITKLAQDGQMYLVARVSCFRDQAMSKGKVGGPLMTRGGNIWYDTWGMSWVSPAAQETRDYLAALCAELAAMGFDEILLESPGFPDLGETHVLATSDLRPEDLNTPVSQFLAQASAALDGTDARLALVATQGTIAGTDTLSGMTAALLAQYAGRVWVTLPEDRGAAYAASLEQAGMEQAAARLVGFGVGSGESWTNMKDPAVGR